MTLAPAQNGVLGRCQPRLSNMPLIGQKAPTSMRPVTTGLMLKGRSRIASSTVLPGKLLRAISSAAEMPNSVLMGTATAASASVSCTCSGMLAGAHQQVPYRAGSNIRRRPMIKTCASAVCQVRRSASACPAQSAHRVKEVWI